MRKSLLFFIGILFVSLLLVGSVAGATQTLTVVRDGNNVLPLSDDTGTYGEVGDMYVLVTDFNKVYYYHHSEIASEQDLSSSVADYSSRFETVVQYEYGEVTSENVGAYVDLNILNTYISREEVHYDFNSLSSSTNPIIGHKKNGAIYSPRIRENGDIQSYWLSYIVNIPSATGEHTLVLTNTPSATLDGESYTLNSNSGNYDNLNLYLFVGKVSSDIYGVGKIYNVKIDTTQNEHRDVYFVTTDSTVRALDKANWNFLTTSGTINVGGTYQTLTFPHEISGAPSVTVTTPSSPVAINTAINLDATASPYVAGNHLTYNWQYSTDSGSTWSASIGTTEDITYTPTGNPAVYQFRCTVTETETTLSASATTNDVRVVTAPTINTATITPSIGKLSTAYTPAITIPITGLGGAQTVYYKLQQLSGSTWSDISGKAGTATATGSKTLTVSINDASETTHSYRVLVSSLSDYTASVTATSNTVTFTTFAPPATPTAEIRPSTITINTATEVTLTASNVPTAPTGNTYYYQWFYGSTSTPSSGDTAITEQETTLTNPATWSATFTATGTKYVYLKITDAAGNDPVYSARQTLTISNYAPPTITMVSRQTSSPALTGSDVKVKVIATSYEGTTTHLTYKWYYAVSSASPEWTEISGQTTNILTTQFSTEGTYMLKCVVTDTSISMSTDSYTAGKYATVQIVPQPSISAVAVNPYVLDLSVSTTVQLSASITNPSGVSSLVWQVQKDGGEWTNTPLTLDHGTVTVSSAGTYLYRLQVTPIVGSVITSENTHSVVAGTLPVISIVSPPNNSQYGVGETIQINATGTGVTAIQWSFGDGVKASGNTNTLTPWVQYTGIGIHTITLTAANSFGNKTASIQIIVSSAKRPLATSTPAPIKDANMVYEWMENFNPQSAEDQSPDVMGIFKGLTAPFTNVMGQWFYLALFGIPYLLIWIRTRNTIIPSIIGILFGAWLWVMLPGSAMAAAVCILILSVSGGIFGIYLSGR